MSASNPHCPIASRILALCLAQFVAWGQPAAAYAGQRKLNHLRIDQMQQVVDPPLVGSSKALLASSFSLPHALGADADVPSEYDLSFPVSIVSVESMNGRQGGGFKLLDRDPRTSVSSETGEPLALRVSLGNKQLVEGISFFGADAGMVRVHSVLPDGSAGKMLFEGKSQSSLNSWQFVRSPSPVSARSLLIYLEQSGERGPAEISVWARQSKTKVLAGRTVRERLLAGLLPSGTEHQALPQRQRVGNLSGGGGEARTFEWLIPEKTGRAQRAFLVYELSGISSWQGVPRSINASALQGQVGEATGGAGGLQVEEISPGLLKVGRNRVDFYPVDGHVAAEYQISDLRVVTVSDTGRVGTFAQVESSEVKSGYQGVLEWGGETQAVELSFHLRQQSVGKLSLSSNTGETFVIDLAGLAVGWHGIALDSAAPSTRFSLFTSKEAVGGAVGQALLTGLARVDAAPPALVVTSTSDGRCRDGKVYVRGFIRSDDGQKLSYLVANGQDVVRRSEGGEFELLVDDPGKGLDWGLRLGAELSNGSSFRQEFVFSPCATTIVSPTAQHERTEDLGAPFSALVQPESSAVLQFAGATLEIPAGAVSEPTRITIRPLSKDQITDLNLGMANVTPGNGGFRFGPHGMQFEKPIKLTLPYDDTALPRAASEQHVVAFYHDEKLGGWKHVGRFGQAEIGSLTSLTDHFTDFITATVPSPDAPGSKSFNPNEMSGIEMANPSAGIRLIQPPSPNAQGSANLNYPLELPPGRRGMQPQLAVTYNSNGGNSWLGKGWNLNLSTIELDTRYGVPDYDKRWTQGVANSKGGRIVPLLDGAQLEKVSESPAGSVYRRRVEGSFQRIVNLPASDGGSYWVVTNQDGTKYTYGLSPDTRLADPSNAAHVFRWHLETVEDTFGNGILYSYEKDEENAWTANEVPTLQLYPARIDYTTHAGGEVGSYSVLFHRVKREDTQVSGRSGFLVTGNYLLQSVDILYGSSLIRSYEFNFAPGAFGRSLLQKLDVLGSGGTVFNSHEFGYREKPAVFLADAKPWAGLDGDSGLMGATTLSHSKGNSQSASISVGASVGFASLDFGGGGNWGRSTVRTAGGDFNGDGRFDFLQARGGLLNSSYFGNSLPVGPGLENAGFYLEDYANSTKYALGRSKSSGWNVEVSGNILVLNAAGSIARTANEAQHISTDMDGDGMPDHVWIDDGKVYVALGSSSGFLPRRQWSGLDLEDVKLTDAYSDELNATSFAVDPIISWNAPRSGNVVISGGARKIEAGGDGVQLRIYQGNSIIWDHQLGGNDLSECGPNQGGGCGPGLEIDVTAGENLYFRVSSGASARKDAVKWLPTIRYGGAELDKKEPYGRPLDQFSVEDDFRTAGGPAVYWGARGSGQVRVHGALTKRPTADEVTVAVYTVDATDDKQRRLGTVYTRTFAANEDVALTMDTNEVKVNGQTLPLLIDGSVSLEFEIVSDTPIDPARVSWAPVVEYETYFRPDVGGEPFDEENVTLQGGDVDCVPDGSDYICTIENDPSPESPISHSLISSPGFVNVSMFEWMAVGYTHQSIVENGGEPPKLAGGTISKTTQDAAVHFVCQGLHRLLYKKTFSGGWTGIFTLPEVDLSLDAGEAVTCSIYSDGSLNGVSVELVSKGLSPELEVNKRAAKTTNPRLVRFAQRAVKTDEGAYSGGFQRFRYGDWNGNVDFDESLMRYSLVKADLESDSPGDSAAFPATPLDMAWSIRGAGYISVDQIKPGRSTVAASLSTGKTGGLDSLRSGHTWNFALSAGVSIGVAGVDMSAAVSRNTSDMDMVDLNGDGFPDSLTQSGVRYNTGCQDDKGDALEPEACTGGFVPELNSQFAKKFRSSSTILASTSANVGNGSFPGTKVKLVQHDEKGKAQGSKSIGFSVGVDYGLTSSETELIDINGDGLVDFVTWDAKGTGKNTVRLNLGYSLSQPIPWQQSWSKLESDAYDVTAGLQFANGAVHELVNKVGDALDFVPEVNPGSPVYSDLLSARVGLSIGGAVSVGLFGGGGNVGMGYTHGMRRDISQFVDLTGDGLPEFVTMVPGSGVLNVYPNHGTSFGAMQEWTVPSWTKTPGNYVFNSVLAAAYGANDKAFDVLGFERSRNYQVSTSAKLCVFGVCVSTTFAHTSNSSHSEMGLRDVNGDGLVDMAMKLKNGGVLHAKLNQLGLVDTLTSVTGPLGGTIAIKYGRQGNTFQQQGSRNIMVSVETSDGLTNQLYTSRFDYKQSGYFSRHEREFYAFSAVETLRDDISRIYTNFENSDFYRKGLVAGTSFTDPTGWLLQRTNYNYNGPSDDFSDDLSVPSYDLGNSRTVFPAEISRTMIHAEQLEQRSKTTSETREWNSNHGGLAKLTQRGDEGAADDLIYEIEYESQGLPASTDDEVYFVRASDIQAKGVDNVTYRHRKASFDPATGAATSVTDYITGGEKPNGGTYSSTASTTLIDSRDQYGNVTSVTDPNGYNLAYTYDTETSSHVVSTRDSFDYVSSGTVNYQFGTPDMVTDTNGHITQFAYDEFGRSTSVWGPKDVNSQVPTIVFSYALPGMTARPAWAKTGHKDVFRNGESASAAEHDFIETVTFMDGLERVIQTKKDLEHDNGTLLRVGMTVSGAQVFDEMGRVAQSGHPIFSEESATSYVSVPMVNPTTTKYDPLNRMKYLTTPHEGIDPTVTTWTKYGFAMDKNDVLRKATTVTDPMNHQKVVLRDLNDSIVEVHERNTVDGESKLLVTSYEYNPVKELLAVTDAKGNTTRSAYDTLGRMISLDSPDMGLTKWRYDEGGNLRHKESAQLRAKGQSVTYNYEFNRLASISYPESEDKFFSYGGADEKGNAFGNVAGRIKFESSEAGTKNLAYDELGNTIEMTSSFVRMREKHLGNYEYTVKYEFDSFARAKKAWLPGKGDEVVTYHYDAGGNVQSAWGLNTKVTPERPSETFHTDYMVHIGYDEFGQKVRTISGNLVETTYEYKPGSRRLSGVNAFHRDIFAQQRMQTGKFFQQLNYEYDEVGNVTQMRNDAPYNTTDYTPVPVGSLVQNYEYDELYQLTSADGFLQSTDYWAHRYAYTQSYDEIGNILVKDQSSFRMTSDGAGGMRDDYEQPALSVIQAYTYGQRPHAPVNLRERTPDHNTDYDRVVEYDASGNQTQWTFRDQVRQVEWNEDDQIKRTIKNSQDVTKTLYDAQGNKAVHVHFLPQQWETAYLGPNITIRNGEFVTKHIYVGEQQVASKMAPEWVQFPLTTYYHPDHLGSVQYATNDDQSLIQHDEFYPSGEPWQDETDLRYEVRRKYIFTGKELDIYLGVYDYGARSYDPRMGVWMSPDPALAQYILEANRALKAVMRSKNESGFSSSSTVSELAASYAFISITSNLYSFTANNPVNLIDPDGRAVTGIYDKDKGKLTLTDDDSGETLTVNAESGGKPQGNPIPNGGWEIFEHPDPGYYRLDADDSSPRDDKHESTGRDRIRLHLPGNTTGCIAVKSKGEWAKVKDLLSRTKSKKVKVTSTPGLVVRIKRWLMGEPITRVESSTYYGKITAMGGKSKRGRRKAKPRGAR